MKERQKRGEKCGMQIAQPDMVEDAKQRSRLRRKEEREALDQERVLKEAQVEIELQERVEAAEAEAEANGDYETAKTTSETEVGKTIKVEGAESLLAEDTEDTKAKKILSKRNFTEIPLTAGSSIRYGVSVRGTSAVCSSYVADLINAGILSPSKIYLALDPGKLRRARDSLMSSATGRGNDMTDEADIQCVMFDSRLDQTKVRSYDEETGKYYPDVVTEDHYTLTDGDGRFLVHLTKPAKAIQDYGDEDEEDEEREEEANNKGEEEEEEEKDQMNEEPEDRERRERLEKIIDQNPKPAAIVARMMYNWMRIHGVDKSVLFLAGDSTNSNTGWKNGIMAWLERFLGRKVSWLVCQLHTNELGLRHLFQELDGKTDSKTGWSGEIGKLLKTVSDMEVNSDYKAINLGDMIDLPKEIEDQLSTDQSLLYKRVQAVRSGYLPRDVALRTGGSLVHSRWLTFASELCMLWMSKHGLTGALFERLETVVTYIVSVYAPLWFEIKAQHSWIHGPRHVIKHLQCLRLQSSEVQRILIPYLKTSSWYAHSEAILQTMLSSSDQGERAFAVEKILKIRGRDLFGKSGPRYRKLPKMNVESTTLVDLIDWRRAHEPVLTLKLTKEEIANFKIQPMQVPYLPGHTQAIERAVKEV